MQALVALVVGAGIEHLVVDDEVVVAVQDLADEREAIARAAIEARLRPQFAGETMKALHEVAVEAVGDVEAQARASTCARRPAGDR